MSRIATFTSKGQVTIPKSARDELGLTPGTRCDVEVVDGKLVLAPRRKRLADLAGMLGRPPRGGGATVEDMADSIGDHLAEDDARIVRGWNESRG